MFYISENNIITMERGDYGSVKLQVNIGTTRAPKNHFLEGDDRLYLGVMEPGQPFEKATIKKSFSVKDQNQEDATVTVEFDPSDTLLLTPGTYYWEVKLRILTSEEEKVSNGFRPSKVYTLLPKTKFIIWG